MSWSRVLLISIGLTAPLLAACDDDPTSSSREFAEQSFSQEFAVTTQTMFDLTGINGSITVEGHPGVTKVSLSGTRRVESDSKEDAAQRLDDLVVVTSTTQNEIRVHTQQPQNTDGRNYVVEYVVSLPEALVMNLANVNGSISLSGSVSDATIGIANGAIDFDNVRGSMVARVANGSISGDVSALPGTIDLGTSNGSIDVRIPKNGSCTISAALANGRIRVIGLTLADRVQTERTLTGRLGLGEGRLDMVTANGNITLSGI